jgi:hypothetical protein
MISLSILLASGLAIQAKNNDTFINDTRFELISRIDNLSNSCSKNVNGRLAAADHLMELIVRRIKKTGSAQYEIEKHVWEAGDLLFRLTISFQQNQLTTHQCLTGAAIIKKKLLVRSRS